MAIQGFNMEEFLVEFQEIRNETRKQIADFRDEAKMAIETTAEKIRDGLKEDLKEIKDSLKEMNSHRENLNTNMIKLDSETKNNTKDINEIFNKLREKDKLEDQLKNDNIAFDLEIKFAKRLGGFASAISIIVFGGFILAVIVKLFKL